MKLNVKMCHSHLMSMLLQPEDFNNCVNSYTATSPEMQYEGMAGYMEVNATFDIKDLSRFAKLWDASYSYPSNRSKWYHTVKNAINICNKE